MAQAAPDDLRPPAGGRPPYPARWLCEQLVRSRIELTSQAGLATHAPGHETKPRIFRDYDIHYVQKGAMEYVFDDRAVRADEKHFVLLPPGKPFVQREARGVNAGVALFFAHFMPLGDGPDPLQTLDLPVKVRAIDPIAAEALWRRLSAHSHAVREGDPWSMLHGKAELLELLAMLLEAAMQKRKLQFDPRRVGPPWLWQVLAEMDRRMAQPDLDVPHLARAAHLSPSQFAHQFRRYFGLPPMKLLMRKRMERACALLVGNEALPIKEIAAACGFSDPYHFSAQFKRHVKIAPSDYRRTVEKL
ncbi:MAG: AraC family transcriptional regulator [Planctomycetota bacterium]|nr:AraC family transcriptional regulator [Planctomycetota bacterium]